MRRINKILLAMIMIFGSVALNHVHTNAKENLSYNDIVDKIVEKSGLPYYAIENDLENYSEKSGQNNELIAQILLDEIE